MTGANEFWKIYKLDVIAFTTGISSGSTRRDLPFGREKYAAIVEIERIHKWDVLMVTTGEIWGQIADGRRDRFIEAARRTIPRAKIKISRRGIRLVGTVSIEKSELLSSMLDKGISTRCSTPSITSAAEIVPGRAEGAVTSTNMCG